MSEIIKSVLTVLGTLGVAYLAYLGQRFIRKSSDQATKDDRDAAWNADYRTGAERHMRWDFDVLRVLERLQNAHNDLETDLGREKTAFPAIKDPPPLFPERERPSGKP